MKTRLSNEITLVTGVSSGIGQEIATMLAERGARVFGTVRNPQSAAFAGGVELVRMDVTDDSSVTEAVQNIMKKAGPIQFLVNSAGYSFMGALEETSVAEARQQFETNFFGVLRVTNAVLPGMRLLGNGRIVNISSVLGFLPAPYWGIYAASKHAVEGYTESLDHEILHEDKTQRKHQIRKNHARRLRGPAEALDRRDAAKHRTRRRSSTGGGRGLEGIDGEVATAALSGR
jgi:NAD(P)-dependent dehydrogenase (short-subunit alcohol dehydrogenase family)